MSVRLSLHLIALFFLVGSQAARAQEEWPAIFNPFRVETIHIEIDPAKWNAIKRDQNFYDPVLNLREPCWMWMEGPNPPNSRATALQVQIRRKSDPALPDEGNPQKVSLKIDVNEYVPGQSIRGLKKLSLENGSGNGVLKEAFAMNLHRMAADAGFYPHQMFYASWVRLIVNGEYVGLYSSPEQRDKTFLKNRGMYREGASWLYEINGGIFLDETVATANSPTHDHLNYSPFRGTINPPANFESDAQAWVDVRSMLTMAAIEAWIANTDGLFTKSAANQGKNSFCVDWLPSLERRRIYLPWDLDGGFSNTTWDIFTGGSGSSGSRQYQRRFLDHPWFGQVYRQIFTDLLDGPMSTAALNAWLDQVEQTVGPAFAEDPLIGESFANLRSFISARNTNVRTQIGSIIRPPAFGRSPGEIAAGFELNLSHPNTTGTSTIYYTLDGTDPRSPVIPATLAGAISPGALAYTGPITLNDHTRIVARVRNVNGSVVNWSDLREGVFNISASLEKLRITEVMYQPLGDPIFEDKDEFEFIELKNTGAVPLRLDGCRLTGVSFAFSPGTIVPAGGYLVLVANPAAFSQRYPAVSVHGAYFRNLSNTGERIAVVNSEGTTIDEVDYSANPPWPVGADGLGYSLVRRGSGEDASNWRASTAIHGSPGADDPAPPYGLGLVINEVIAKTNTPLEDAIELHNPTDTAVDISGWWLSDSYDPNDPARAALKKFRIPAGTVIAPGGFHVFYEAAFNPASPTANALVPFGLGQGGDAIYLSAADTAGNLTGHIVGQRFGASADGVSFGRFATSNGVDFTPLAAHSFGVSAPATKTEFRSGTGAANAGALFGPVVISEIMYEPAAGGAEFIEILNISANPVHLDGWILRGAGAFTFPAGTSLAPGGYALLVDTADTTEAAFRAENNVPAAVPVFGAVFDLGNGGEALELQRPNTASGNPPLLVDRVRYNDKTPWPVAAAGAGPSLERIVPSAYGNEPLNWASSVLGGTPGRSGPGSIHMAIAKGGRWNFHAHHRSLGTAWRNRTYRDGAWLGGPSPLGTGFAGLGTVIPYATTRPLTTYLRKDFAVAVSPGQIGALTLRVNYNDGFIAYLNGTEVARRSLPSSGVTFDTPADAHPAGVFETVDLTSHLGLLQSGKNTLAIELHLTSASDPDAYWDAELSYQVTSLQPADSDGDGLPDAWEITHLLNPADDTDAPLDTDGDGQSNLAEYRAGTNPQDPNSAFRIAGIEWEETGCRITLATIPGKTYRVEYSPDLKDWFPLGTDVTAEANTLEFVDSDPPLNGKRFYHALIPAGL